VIHEWEWSYLSWPCGELPSGAVRACQREVIRPEGFHTLGSTAAIEAMTLFSPGMYAVASGVNTPVLSTFLMNHNLTIAGFQGIDGVVDLRLE
jgi:hypothetical protein